MVSTITPTTSTHSPKPTTTTAATNQSTPRAPLLPSERDNGGRHPTSTLLSKKPKPKPITSRYMSSYTPSSSSKRFPSPLPSRPSSSAAAATTPLPPSKRSQSVDRSRPITPRPITPLPNSRTGNAPQTSSSASKLLLTSTRSLSVSFQGEAYSLPIAKVRAPLERRNTATTPLRGRVHKDQLEHSKPSSNPLDQHRWPGRNRLVSDLTTSMDFTGEKSRVVGSDSVSGVLKQSMIDLDRRASFDGRVSPKLGGGEISKISIIKDLSIGSVGFEDVITSDTESVSSGSNAGSQEWGGIGHGRSAPPATQGISVPARFWQETNSRMRLLQEPGSPLSRSPGSKASAPPKFVPLKRTSSDTPLSLSSPRNTPVSRTLSSPLRGPGRPSSPSKPMVPSTPSPARGTPSPSRTRNAAMGNGISPLNNTPSILSFVVDSRRSKIGQNKIVDAHLLRLLYNRQLQWRFINARADAILFVKRLTVERNLYNAWITTSELHDSITIKRIKLQLLRQNLKLISVLKGQMIYFKEWALLDRDYSSSLSGAVEALEASTLPLPVVCGAKADVQNVMDAIGSAVSVMQAIVSSLCSLISKVEEVSLLMAELANGTAKERDLLAQCRDNLSILSAMQVKDCSLRTHRLQLYRVSTTSKLTTQVQN